MIVTVAQTLTHSETTTVEKPPLVEEKQDFEPPENMELVDGELIEKKGMSFKHGLAQTNLACAWANYITASQQQGKVVTETACHTEKQTRRPDVAYITKELLNEVGTFTTLPQSFPLVGEIASPDDSAEKLFSKAREYLSSGCEEVWLLFPDNQIIMIILADKWLVFTQEETVATQVMLKGFKVKVQELLE